MFLRSGRICFIFMLFVALSPAIVFAGKPVTITGDPCSLPLAMKLAEAYAKKDKSFSAEAKQVSCMLGVYQAANGDSEIGVSTQNGLSSNLPKKGRNFVLAKAPIVLVVNKKNPVNDITYEQLQGIYEGKIFNWKQLGGKDMVIQNVMLAPCVRYSMSKKVAVYNEGITKLVPEKKGNPVMGTNTMVLENEGAIGQQLFGYESKDLKVLSVDGVYPAEDTVPDKYPYFEEYNFVTQGEPTGAAKALLDFARSEEGKSVIRSMKHVPVI